MRIVSWNMRRSKNAWSYLVDALKPDIALLQETGSLPAFTSHFDQHRVIETLVHKNLRNSIYFRSRKNTELKVLDRQKAGLISSSYLDKPKRRIFIVSVYGSIRKFSGNLDFALIEALQEYVESLRNDFRAQHILIAGDFNMDRRMDENPTSSRFSKKGETRHSNFFDGILDLGFKDCQRKRLPLPVQTFRHSRGNYPWELDHMFATPALWSRLKRLNVYLDDRIMALSDHNPIVADFD